MRLDKLHTHYRLVIETLSPVHIGAGKELIRDYDYLVHDDKTWVLNQEVYNSRLLSQAGEFSNTLLGRPASEVLRPEDYYEGNPIFQYILAGEPVNRPLFEQIKDAWGRPYLPGSSIKGMLRTLLLWSEAREPLLSVKRGPVFDPRSRQNVPGFVWEQAATEQHGQRQGEFSPQPKYAAQPLEQALFAPQARQDRDTPNFDVLRALHVADSPPLDDQALFSVVPTQVYPAADAAGRRGNIDVAVEAVLAPAAFDISLGIEKYGFENDEARRKLGWNDAMRDWFATLPIEGREHARQHLVHEVEFFTRLGKPAPVRRFYSELADTWKALGKNEWLVQLGWGTNWDSKTLGSVLRAQGDVFDELVNYYELTGRDAQGKPRTHKSGQPFPATRKLVLDAFGKPAVPMGWVKCRLEKLS